jgi:UDP-hydrolysing UDP-N-acetyl-D-glucosamine 2-epimerase
MEAVWERIKADPGLAGGLSEYYVADPSQAVAVAHNINHFGNWFRAIGPDIVLVLGDRVEAFGAAIAASLGGCVLAHIHGGDVSRGYDEYMRHAITKLAHLHFCATARSAGRVMGMGERPDRVWVTGSPALDGLDMKWQSGKYIVVLHHPVSTKPEMAYGEMGLLLSAACSLNCPVVIVRPTSDPGDSETNRCIDQYGKEPTVHVWDDMPRPDFLKLLCGCACLIGNSSAGLIEASYLGVPVVNVGRRQDGRERAENVIDVPIPTVAGIQEAIALCGVLSPRQSTLYGDGHAAERIVSILKSVSLDGLREKQICI